MDVIKNLLAFDSNSQRPSYSNLTIISRQYWVKSCTLHYIQIHTKTMKWNKSSKGSTIRRVISYRKVRFLNRLNDTRAKRRMCGTYTKSAPQKYAKWEPFPVTNKDIIYYLFYLHSPHSCIL